MARGMKPLKTVSSIQTLHVFTWLKPGANEIDQSKNN